MKLRTQLAALLVVSAVSGLGWYYKDQLPYLNSLGKAAAPGAAPAGRQAGNPIPVEVTRVQTRELSTIVEAVGSANANEAVTITAKATGTVAKIGFTEGQKVAAGAILVELDAGENRAKMEELRAARESIQQNLARSKALLEANAMAKAKVEDLEKGLEVAEAKLRAEQAKYGDTVLRAPFAGKLGLRMMSLGALVKPGDIITTLDDISVMKLEFEVPETVLAAMAPGLKISALSATYPGRKFEGVVNLVDTRVDPITRSSKVRALIPNQDEALRPGMFMTVQLAINRKQSANVVPEEALLVQGGQQFLFVVREGRAYRTRVAIGQRMPGIVEITEGVDPGTMVVTGGLQKVRDGAPVKPIEPLGQPAAPQQVPSAGTPGKPKPAS